MTTKVAFMQLSSCWGCHQSLVDNHLKLLPILPHMEIVYWPAIMDFKDVDLESMEDGEIDLGFLEGMVRTKADTHNVYLMRQKCKKIITIGACSCHGSIPGLANLFDIEELVRRKFIEVESISDPEPVDAITRILGFEEFVENVKELIDVDMAIPGCPPTTNNILSALMYLLALEQGGPENADKNKCVCESCDLFEEGCLLAEERLCYGGITAGGCNLMCPNKGYPCFGCYQPTSKPGPKGQQLHKILMNLLKLNEEWSRSIQHYLDVAFMSSNFTHFYYKGDLLQRLAYEPESYTTTELNGRKIIDIKVCDVDVVNEIVGRILHLLQDDPTFKFSTKSVCSHCNREIVDKVPVNLKRDYEGLPSMEKCFLEQGYICLGPVTQAGCGTLCPNRGNAPCMGCFGPPVGVKEQGAKFISTIGSLCADKDPEDVVKMIKDPAGFFNRFTLAASTLKHKYHDEIES